MRESSATAASASGKYRISPEYSGTPLRAFASVGSMERPYAVEHAPQHVGAHEADRGEDQPNVKRLRRRDVKAEQRENQQVRNPVDRETDEDVGPRFQKRAEVRLAHAATIATSKRWRATSPCSR